MYCMQDLEHYFAQIFKVCGSFLDKTVKKKSLCKSLESPSISLYFAGEMENMSGEVKHAEIQYSGQIQSLHSSDDFKC